MHLHMQDSWGLAMQGEHELIFSVPHMHIMHQNAWLSRTQPCMLYALLSLREIKDYLQSTSILNFWQALNIR